MPGDSPLHIKKTETDMIIYGTALLAACHLLLMAARLYMLQHNKLPKLTELGVEYWGAMYIPVVVAMAAQQDMVSALRGGPVAVLSAVAAVAVCAVVIALINRAEVVSPESPDAAQLHNPLVAAGE